MSDLEVFSNPQIAPAHRPGPPARTHALAAGSPSTRVAWMLRRHHESARCVVCTVGDRVELHITMTHDVVMTQQCSGPDQAAAISNAWWMALLKRGWIDATSEVTLEPKVDRRSSRKAPR